MVDTEGLPLPEANQTPEVPNGEADVFTGDSLEKEGFQGMVRLQRDETQISETNSVGLRRR